MVFYSAPFLIFFLFGSLLLHCSKSSRQQRWIILFANIIFYGYWSVKLLVLLFGVIGICYLSAVFYSKTQKRLYLIIAVIACLAVLGICKYYNFFVEAFCQMTGMANAFSLNLVLPLGISFYIFQALSYVLDVGNGTIPAETDFVKLAAYLSFFPQITSGPIVKAHDFLPQLDILHRIKKENLYRGVQLVLMGLTKKLVFADRIGVAVNAVYQAPGAYSGISILFALMGYAMQIYFDFSGYSDMAIGIAAIWDFDLGKNFNAPYLAKNPSDFWRRWHISLSSWFRDYVYIPLGGGRCGKWKTYRNILITMFLSGLWHGANWTFLVWGLLHGVGSIANKLWKEIAGRSAAKEYNWLRILANNAFVILLWVVFRAESLQKAFAIYTGLFRFEGIFYVNVYVAISLVVMILGNIIAYYRNDGNAIEINLNLDKFGNKLIISIWILLIAMFAYTGNSAFIYAQF